MFNHKFFVNENIKYGLLCWEKTNKKGLKDINVLINRCILKKYNDSVKNKICGKLVSVQIRSFYD